MTSTTPTPSSSSSYRSKKVLVPKVWKRPHSTIYGKNVEFGSSLYSDKIGELNGRKFNSELPWTMRNSGTPASGASSPGIYNQGYLSNNSLVEQPTSSYTSVGNSYADLLESTNPNRFSKRNKDKNAAGMLATNKRIDFYDQYMDFSNEIDHLHNSSLLMNEPLFMRKVFDNFLDFDHELGLFVPNHDSSGYGDEHSTKNNRSCSGSSSGRVDKGSIYNAKEKVDINTKSFVPFVSTTTQQNTKLLPKHQCQLMNSPYGQSADGRKLSLGSINPQSYRPSLPQKTTVAHASDGEEFEFHDRSSPFYTDRWAGKTIRHFDSDLYSNANLFKSMIL